MSILGGNHYHPTYTLVPCRRPDSFYITIAAYDLKMWLEVDASTHVSTVMNRVQVMTILVSPILVRPHTRSQHTMD